MRNCQAFSQWLHHYNFPLAMHRVPVSPHCHQYLFFFFLNNSHLNECEMSHSGFDCYFSNDWWCWVSFYLLIDHLYIFGGMSIPVLSLDLNLVVCFLVVSFRCSLYILDINPLSDMWFASIYSHSVGCLWTLLLMFFDSLKSLIFLKSSLSVFSLSGFCCYIEEIVAESVIMRLFPSVLF